MSDRVTVDDTLRPVRVPREILHELYQHARESLPDECCGLIVGEAGNGDERFEKAVRCRNEMTKLHEDDPDRHPHSGREAFWMNELDYQKAQRDADENGHRITAVYHSHVNAGVYLSEMDIDYAVNPHFPFPLAVHIVLSVSGDGTVRGRGFFERSGPGRAFVGAGIAES